MNVIGHNHVIARSEPRVNLMKVPPKGLHRLAEARELWPRLLIDELRQHLRAPGNGECDEEELYAPMIEIELHLL